MDYTNIEKYKTWLKKNLSDERYEHSLGVSECAKELALRFNLDAQKAELAGLIHDCAKCINNDELKLMIEDLPDLCDGELINHKTFHAPAGVIVAKREFGIEDEEILSSIRWHTIGKIGMTDFEKVIFIADKIETRTRPEEWSAPIREALNIGLDEAMFVSFSETIKSLVERKLYICKSTIDIYNDLLNKIKQ